MREVEGPTPSPHGDRPESATLLFKDDVLSELAEVANVAQFVSYDPRLAQRHARIYGYEAEHRFESIEAAVSALLTASPENSVNIRCFIPGESKSLKFIYGLTDADEVVAAVRDLASEGLYTIINETVDINDGGISGVALGDLLEFAPRDTPRCVEKPGTASLPRLLGLRLLEKVYRFRPNLSNYTRNQRVEFSIHPIKRGVEHDHTIIWEIGQFDEVKAVADIRWPNNFSRFMGDKAFGLLIADMLGLLVPATTVFPRFLPPFSFGTSTGTGEVWIRTCPVEQDPGKFTTRHGWLDPYKLMAEEDPEGTKISSVLAQEGVDALYSGALIVGTRPSLLGVDDVLDWPGLFSWLSDEGGNDALNPSHRIIELLPDSIYEMVIRDPRAENLNPIGKADFVSALNDIVRDRDFYRSRYFRRIALTNEAEMLSNRAAFDLSQNEVERLNRLLLEASYPKEIAKSEEIIVQGVRGYGDNFMLGSAAIGELPEYVKDSVLQLYEQAAAALGPVRFEWVRDRERVWIAQFHRGATATTGSVIYPGEAEVYHRFDVREGIDALRALIAEVKGTKDGIILEGNVGVTSHLGDLLRRAKIPSKIEPSQRN